MSSGVGSLELSAVSPKHRKVVSMAVLDPDTPEAVWDPAHVGPPLAQHWGPEFSAVDPQSPASPAAFLAMRPRSSQFRAGRCNAKVSSPGPDGLP